MEQQQTENEIICLICQDPLSAELVQTNCRQGNRLFHHTFCVDCCTRWLLVAAERDDRHCPYCRTTDFDFDLEVQVVADPFWDPFLSTDLRDLLNSMRSNSDRRESVENSEQSSNSVYLDDLQELDYSDAKSSHGVEPQTLVISK